MCMFAKIQFRSVSYIFPNPKMQTVFSQVTFWGPLTFISLLKHKPTFEVILYIVLSIYNLSPSSYPYVQGGYTHTTCHPTHSLIPVYLYFGP